jgi:hypothetical protein
MGVWRVDPRGDGQIVLDDGVQLLTNLGDVAEENLKPHGMAIAQHLRD